MLVHEKMNTSAMQREMAEKRVNGLKNSVVNILAIAIVGFPRKILFVDIMAYIRCIIPFL